MYFSVYVHKPMLHFMFLEMVVPDFIASIPLLTAHLLSLAQFKSAKSNNQRGGIKHLCPLAAL